MARHSEQVVRPMGRTIRQLAVKAVPNLVVAALVPAVCFLVGRSLWGLPGAIALALAWNLSCQVVRRATGRPFSGLLVVGTFELAIRALVALVLNSAQAYFVAPAIVTALTGVVFAASACTSTPLVSRVIADLVPESVFDVRDPRHARLLRRASVVYGLEQILTSGVSILMIANVSTTVYAAAHPFVSWLVLAAVVAAAAPSFRAQSRSAHRLALPSIGGRTPVAA